MQNLLVERFECVPDIKPTFINASLIHSFPNPQDLSQLAFFMTCLVFFSVGFPAKQNTKISGSGEWYSGDHCNNKSSLSWHYPPGFTLVRSTFCSFCTSCSHRRRCCTLYLCSSNTWQIVPHMRIIHFYKPSLVFLARSGMLPLIYTLQLDEWHCVGIGSMSRGKREKSAHCRMTRIMRNYTRLGD